MSITVERIPLSGPPLATAYLEQADSVRALYLSGPPSDLNSYRRVVEQIRDGYPAARWESLADLLPDASSRIGDRLQRLIEGKGVFVSTGQQAGLFVSPLFTLYKALTASRLARQLEQRLGVPVMGLFSVASEDHDWAEVDHTRIIDLENQLVRLRLDPPFTADATPPVERARLDPQVETVLGVLTESTPNSEFKAAVLEPLRDAYRPGKSFAGAFQAALAHLLRAHEMLIVRTAEPYVKRTSRETLWREWECRQESEMRLGERAEAIRALGFEPQVGFAEGDTNLFLDGKLGRDRILRKGAGGRLRRSGERLSESDLRHILDEAPGRVSPGALLRPVTEARAFPVVAYVGGPGEIAYLAQSQVLFELHELPAPVVVPRAAFQLVEPKVARVLDKYDLKAHDLAGDPTRAIQRILDQHTPPGLEAALSELRHAVGAALESVEAAALEFDPGSRSAVGSGKKAIFGSLKGLESKLQARVREKHDVMRQQLEKAALNLYPEGKPQERVLNPYPFLVRYGEALLDEIYASVVTPLV
jgi:bacillithiol biosynthesis cysteine-adding enzyme BshC